ncbi:hypothetical protein [Colwellia hornerae]|nr:hypothetical protein [Colwellia hornerae]
MSSVVFLISMGFVIYFLIKGHKQDLVDRKREEKGQLKEKKRRRG